MAAEGGSKKSHTEVASQPEGSNFFFVIGKGLLVVGRAAGRGWVK